MTTHFAQLNRKMADHYADGKAVLLKIIQQKERQQAEQEKKKNSILQHQPRKIESLNNMFGSATVDFFEEHLAEAGGGLLLSKDIKKEKEHVELTIAKQEQLKMQ